MTCDVVVCAHNEAKTIGAVLAAILGAPSHGRLIVVADRCTDETAQIARDAGALVLEEEAGTKGSAMALGLREVESLDVAFCDADISGLTSEHVETLLTHPPHPGMVVLLRDGAPLSFGRWPSISGERRVPRRLADEAGLRGSGWKAELRINAACVAAGLPWAHVVARGVTNPRRSKPREWAQVAGAATSRAGLLARMVLHTRRAGR